VPGGRYLGCRPPGHGRSTRRLPAVPPHLLDGALSHRGFGRWAGEATGMGISQDRAASLSGCSDTQRRTARRHHQGRRRTHTWCAWPARNRQYEVHAEKVLEKSRSPAPPPTPAVVQHSSDGVGRTPVSPRGPVWPISMATKRPPGSAPWHGRQKGRGRLQAWQRSILDIGRAGSCSTAPIHGDPSTALLAHDPRAIPRPGQPFRGTLPSPRGAGRHHHADPKQEIMKEARNRP
jgi:hypothetical protein